MRIRQGKHFFGLIKISLAKTDLTFLDLIPRPYFTGSRLDNSAI